MASTRREMARHRAQAAAGGVRRRRRGRARLMACGVDVVELDRLRRAMRRGGQAFMRRVFTQDEVAYARARKRTTLKHLAGRFAAKEAVIKALAQIDPRRVPAMNQVEIRNDRMGRPSIILNDGRRRAVTIHISLSHVDSVAVASAIVTT